MFCTKCGKEVDQGVVFCPYCGASLNENVVPNAASNVVPNVAPNFTNAPGYTNTPAAEAPKSNKLPVNKKTLLFAGIAAAVVVVLIFLALILLKGGSAWDMLSNDAIKVVTEDDECHIVISKSGEVVKGPDIEYFDDVSSSMDGAVKAIIDSEKELYVLSKSGFKKVAEDVRAVLMSASGEGLVYVVRESDEYELFLYDIGKKKSTSVADGLDSYSYLTISPDGKSIAYTDEDYKCHIVVNGKEQDDKIKDAGAIAISDDANYLYYIKNDNFWFKKKKADDAEKLGSNFRSACFNKDLTQVLYICSGDDGYRTYFAKLGKKADSVVAKGSVTTLCPADGQYMSRGYCSIVGKDNLNEQVVYMNDDLYYINKKYKAEKIAGDVDEYCISDDANAVVYRKGEKIYRVSNLRKSLKPKQLDKDLEVKDVKADGDLDSVYYINEDNEIYYISGNKKPKKVYDDSFSGYLYWVQHGDDMYFWLDDEDELYVSENGNKYEKVSGIEDIETVYKENGSLYCRTEDAVYLIDGKKSKKIYER